MKINREELKQYLLNNFDCYADTDEEAIPALTIGQAVDLFEQYVSERANTNETSDKHETEQLNILGVVRSLSEIEEKIIELRKERDKWIDRQRKYIFTKEEKLNGSTVFGNFQENEVKCTKQIQTLNWILGKC